MTRLFNVQRMFANMNIYLFTKVHEFRNVKARATEYVAWLVAGDLRERKTSPTWIYEATRSHKGRSKLLPRPYRSAIRRCLSSSRSRNGTSARLILVMIMLAVLGTTFIFNNYHRFNPVHYYRRNLQHFNFRQLVLGCIKTKFSK